jgi:transcriptional regulator with GAF, ATPase, and Fis domain
MSSRWPLTLALASIEAEIWSTSPFIVFGTVAPADGGLLRFELRTPAVTAVNALRPDEFEPGRSVDQILSAWQAGPMIRVPIDGTDAACFAALPESREPRGEDTQTLERLSRQLAARLHGGESDDARERRLLRIDALSDVLRTLTGTLDLRDVFDQLSAAARRVLPHDSAFGLLFTRVNDQTKIRLHALSVPAGWQLPDVVDNPYPEEMTDGWDFAVHHDLTVDPAERNQAPTRLGLRSSLRLPIRIDGRVAGAVIFSSFRPHTYTVADVPIGRRVADYVTLGLSHQRLAETAREAAALRERAAQLEMLDGLLDTLSGVLDVREVFDRVSQVCDKVMTHDAMSVSIPSDDHTSWTIHVATGALGHIATPFVMRPPTPRLLESHWDYELVPDMAAHDKYNGTPSVNAGMRALLSMPVWVEGRLRATVNFYSRTPGHFTADDLLVTRRIANHIALALSHQQLAEEASRNAEMQARAANLELLDELLATVSDTSAMTEAFERVSTIARKVLPHDVVVLPLGLPDGRHARIAARGGAQARAFPDVVEIPESLLTGGKWEYEIVDDLQAHPEQRTMDAATRGFRSALRVPIRIEGHFLGALVFFSVEAGAFTLSDVPVARRIADRIVLAMERDRGAQASKRADEAAARASKLESRVRALTAELDARTGYRRVVGESAAWRQVLTQATQVAATETTVLLLGESGTGKEVVARFLHRASSRSDGPFVALNCAALPEQLLEAELFGYERGAFTGATQSKPGQLEQAGGGTLFLDEVGEMSPSAQAKFLRVLQEREFQRLGGTRILRTDARIVAATNRDLQRAMEQGTFREDLYYRLNVFAIRLPPLRDRLDDVLPLSDAFLSEYGRNLGRPPAGMSRDAKQKLTRHHWPGNVRELRNTLERAAILCEGGLITEEHLALDVGPRPVAIPAAVVAPASPPAPPPSMVPPTGDLSSMERAMIEQALHNARFNKSKAAKELGLTRAQLYVRMRRHGLE